ncbi:hypothetical protein [Lacipirellula parvula]|uniref:Uncharacterized protein n=1 Tax=Lacipirellula parvula TaxID=2650471 RepID=A0A5K7XPB3_9BACT|nr:hypothetical protein [Lacipirellula parvula]BBO35159.1 hypothetical protein PLANPX_4771 [Lacipirellula parvula]
MTTTDSQRREAFELEGMKYDILIQQQASGDFAGEWYCSACDRGDVCPKRQPSEDSLRQWARHCIAIHHTLEHME